MILRAGLVSVLAISYLFGRVVYNLGDFLYSKILALNTVGWSLAVKAPAADLFFINTRSYIFLMLFIYSVAVFAIIFGRKMTEGKWVFSFNMLYFLIIFRVLAPFWFLKAVYNTILRRKPSWR